MRIPFVGPTYQMEGTSFDNQRCVNFYLIMSESKTSKSPIALRGTPGLLEFATAGGGGIRGGIESANRGFFVSGNEFYEIDKFGVATLRGTLDTSTSIVSMEENPTQIMITDGEYGYIFTRSTNSFVKIADPDFPTAPLDLAYQDGYFVVFISTGFAISGLNNGLTWDALDRTTVESSPDNVVGGKSHKSNLWVYGTKSGEVFQHTGNASFPFQKIPGADIDTGCAAEATIQKIDNSLLWLGTDENGDAIVWRSNGYGALRVSTQAIEKKISEGSDFNESSAWVYHERGHAFYLLQVKGLKTTLCLDLSTMQWHERVYRDTESGLEKQHRGSCHVFFNKKHLVGDRETNQIYEMSLDYYDDNGDPMVSKRISPTISNEKSLISHAQFELDMEPAVGTVTGQGVDPQVMMRYGDAGGRIWSSELWRSLGKMGEYFTRIKWNQLGVSRDRVYSVEISAPVFRQINAAYLNGK